MDPISHAASGALLALSLPKRPLMPYFVPVAALITASPDIDVIFSPAPIDFLLLHRGITHSFAAMPFMAVIFAFLFFPLWRKNSPDAWSYLKTCAFICILLLLHMWLDVVTTYGTMIFLPFSDYRVRLNGIFIIDLLITIPMLLAIYYGRKRKKIAALVLMWVFIYPAGCVGLRMWHEAKAIKRLHAENVTNIAVLPDAFAPFYWRLIYENNQPFEDKEQNLRRADGAAFMQDYTYPNTAKSVHHQGLDALGNPRTALLSYPALRQDIAENLSRASRRAKAFLDFSLMPVEGVKKISENTLQNEEFIIYDLRFGSMLPFVQSIMKLRNGGAPPFLFKARRAAGTWTEVRLVLGGSNKDSQWQKPAPPESASLWSWLVGTY